MTRCALPYRRPRVNADELYTVTASASPGPSPGSSCCGMGGYAALAWQSVEWIMDRGELLAPLTSGCSSADARGRLTLTPRRLHAALRSPPRAVLGTAIYRNVSNVDGRDPSNFRAYQEYPLGPYAYIYATAYQAWCGQRRSGLSITRVCARPCRALNHARTRALQRPQVHGSVRPQPNLPA